MIWNYIKLQKFVINVRFHLYLSSISQMGLMNRLMRIGRQILLKELKNFIRELLAKSIDDDIESMKDEYVDSKLWNGKESFLDDDMIRAGIVIQDNLKLYVMNISYRRLWNVSIRME